MLLNRSKSSMLSFLRKSCVRFHMRIFSKWKICFHIYSSPILLSMTPYLNVYQLYLLVSLAKVLAVYLSLCHFFCSSVYLPLTFHCHWEIWLWQDKFVLFMISIIAILVKLLQIILVYVTSFMVYWFFCLFICIFERSAFYIAIVLCHICLILVEPGVPIVEGSWQKRRRVWKNLKFKGYVNLKEDLKIFFLKCTWNLGGNLIFQVGGGSW